MYICIRNNQDLEFKHKLNLIKMKPSILKMLLIIPVLFFMDWIIMTVLGCTSCFWGAGSVFYSTFYYNFGVALMVLTFLFIAYLIIISFRHPKIHI